MHMGKSMNSFLKGLFRKHLPVLLCGVIQAQTLATTPSAANPAPRSSALPIATLPDSTTALTSSTEPASLPLHVLVGRSIFIATPSRLRRVYVGNPVVLDSFT